MIHLNNRLKQMKSFNAIKYVILWQ